MEFVTLEEIRDARTRIESAAVYTPLLEVPSPSPQPQAPGLRLK